MATLTIRRAAPRIEDDMPLIDKQDPLDAPDAQVVRLSKRTWLKLDAIAARERAGGAKSRLTGKDYARADVVRTFIENSLGMYEAEHGEIEVADEPPAAPAKKKTAKKGGKG